MPSIATVPPAVSSERRNQRREMARARALTDGLLGRVKPEATYERPIPERHRIIFYLGHLEAFDWNLVGRHGLGRQKISRELDDLFAFGIDPPMGELPHDQPNDWPSIEQTRAYGEEVRHEFDRALDEAAPEIVDMAIEHRLMHAETFSYMLQNLPYHQRLLPEPSADSTSSRNGNSDDSRIAKLEMIPITAGPVTLGRKRSDGFGWDNEFDEQTREVASFSMSRYKISNGQYLEFVRRGGPAPHYWRQRDGKWFYHGMSAEIPLPFDWPVYVSHQQAEAYAGWIGKSLPTEEQFHRAAFGTPGGDSEASPARDRSYRNHSWGNEAPGSRFGNFDFAHPDLVPVTASHAGASAFGIEQLVGNGWEWTRTVFAPFHGFAASPAYPGYSANFFDGEHFVLKGASCATDAALVRSSFRNWFRKDYPYAYTTFRVVEN
jgi:formylglycine-generating enzyme required for sulfatase activity